MIKNVSRVMAGIVVALLCLTCKKADVNQGSFPTTSGIILYADNGGNVLKSFGAAPDGNLYFGGYIYNSGNMAAQGFIRKTDMAGKTLWAKTYGGSEDDSFNMVRPTSDGGFICAGATSSYGNGITRKDGIEDAYILKTDANGNLQWQNSFGLQYQDRFMDVVEAPDHGFVAAGSDVDLNTSDGQYEHRAWAVKTDANGAYVYQKEAFVTYYRTEVYGTEFLTDGRIGLAVAQVKSDSVKDQNSYCPALTLFTSNLHGSYGEITYRSFGYCNVNCPYPFVNMLTYADGMVLYCNMYSASGIRSVVVFKVDLTGKVLWEKEFFGEGNASFASVRKDDAGNIIIAGNTQDIHLLNSGWILKIDPSANKLWETHIPAPGCNITAIGSVPVGDHWAIGTNIQQHTNGKESPFYGLLFIDSNGKIVEQKNNR